MELHQLRYFLATVETGSASHAARRCGISQPALSQQLRKLEETLGTELFDRIGRGMVLTDAGRALLPRARRILADVQEARDNLQSDIDAGLSLAIGAIPTIAPYILPDALAALRKQLPHCEISVREDLTERLIEAVVRSELDCALVSTPIDHDLIDLDILAHEELLIALPPDHPLASQKPARTDIALADLRNQPTIALEDIHCLGRQIEGFCSTRRIAPRIVCTTTQLSTIIELVASGLGISFIPEMAAAPAAKAKRGRRACRFFRVRQNKPIRQIAVAWRQGRTRPAAAKAFIETVRCQLASTR